MRYSALFLVASQLTASAEPPYRQELAKETFNFLYAHGLCVEGAEPPCDWVDDGAYQLHRAAKDLYGTKPLSSIAMPETSWARGGYKQFGDPFAAIHFTAIKWQIWLLITYGITVPPATLAKLNG